MARLRVDLVSEHASPLAVLGGADAGGQNVHVAALGSALGALGCAVTIHTRADRAGLPTRVELAPNVEVEHVRAGPATPLRKDDLFTYMPSFAASLRRRWAVDPPDVVHAHFWMSGWASRSAAGRLPVIQTFHALGVVKRRHQGADDTSPPQREAIETELARTVDHVITTSTDELAELVALGADPDRLSVVPCGIDPSVFRPNGRVTSRGRLPHRIVAVSRLVPRKGIADVIAALRWLPDTELVVAGGPPVTELDADSEARRLHEVAGRAHVADRVRLVGSLSRHDVAALLRSADLAVCVPWYEPFGIVPLEAMACGTPVVGSAVGGLLDTVADRRTGLLVPPRRPEAIAAAVRRLLDNPSLRRRMGDEAAAQVRQRFTWAQVARTTLEVYERVAERPTSWAVPA